MKKPAGKSAGAKRSHKKKAKAGGNVVLGPVIKKKVRVPINAAVYSKKESELAQLEVEVRKINRKIEPDKDQIRLHRQAITELTEDIENNTEEREMSVREEYHFNTNEIRVLRVDGGAVLEKRTMTAEERKRQTDVEDVVKDRPRDAEDEPAATPSEAMAAARGEDLDGDEANA
jgi:hypothetical protein